MQRKFKIICGRTQTLEGYLFYNEETKQFDMAVVPANRYKVDLPFQLLISKGITRVPQNIVDNWVDGRIVPPSRQGLPEILAQMGLKEYDRFAMLYHNKGVCQMDTSYIQEVL